jgi:hypothetical protein
MQHRQFPSRKEFAHGSFLLSFSMQETFRMNDIQRPAGSTERERMSLIRFAPESFLSAGESSLRGTSFTRWLRIAYRMKNGRGFENKPNDLNLACRMHGNQNSGSKARAAFSFRKCF